MPFRSLIRTATPPPRDLWPRLRARLRDEEDLVHLELPAFGWAWRVVAAATAASPWFVSQPWRFLAAAGVF